MLPKTSGPGSANMKNCQSEPPSNIKEDNHVDTVHQKHENKVNLDVKLHDIDPSLREVLRELVSLIHDGVNAANPQCSSTSDSRVISDRDCKNKCITKPYGRNGTNQQDQCTSKGDPGVFSDKESKKKLITNLYHLEDDLIANILWHLEPLDLLTTFLAMVHSFPRTLEALMSHMLSPVGAEVLTRKFEELDQKLTEEDRSTFYQKFYSVFDDQFSVMDTILRGKESFANQAFKNVLQLYMGVTLDGSGCTH